MTVGTLEAVMTRDEAKALKRGLYRIFWKESHGGGTSIAAIGSTGNGNRWLAPTNWVGFSTDDDKIADSWDAVERVEVIEANNE